MVDLQGELINLRLLKLEDLAFLYSLENNESLWELSQTHKPFSKEVLHSYLETSQKDIKEIKQLRLMISSKTNDPLGFIDLFDYDIHNNRAGVSIVLIDKQRRKGYGKDALSLLIKYSFSELSLHQLYGNILEDNIASMHLFKSVGFEKVGLKRDWRFYKGLYKNEYLFQLINHVL
jgi:diamine N-acetyltransferase